MSSPYYGRNPIATGQSRGVFRIPPRRPYLSLFEASSLVTCSLLGLAAYSLPLLAQYDDLSNALHLVPNSLQRPSSIPSSILDGLFAPRFLILGNSVPAGLVALIGLLFVIYALKQSSWRLTIRNVHAQEWCQPLVDSIGILGLGLWLATFSQILPHNNVTWVYVLAANIIFWIPPIVGRIAASDKHGEAWSYTRHRIPFSVLVTLIEFWFMNYMGMSLPGTLIVFVVSIPLGVLLYFVSMLIWIIKTNVITHEWDDYYLTDTERTA